jgi:2-polyprenyl-3-methyl-5-hydroxy-6-metoxy-1,4-benzoquinol methylase
MDRAQKNTIPKAIQNNPWYTSKQLIAAQGHQRRTIQQRYRFVVQSVEDYLKFCCRKPVHILDAGCGDGVQLQVLTQISGLEVWGADCNLLRTGRARQNFPTAQIVCCDLFSPPFRPAYFDIILCSQVIEHIAKDDLLLKRLADILKPRGLLILGAPNEGCFMGRVRNHIFERSILKSTDHIHFYTEPVIRQKIEAAGFVIQQVIRQNWFFPHQRINNYFAARDWGFRLMVWLNSTIPSQTAGYYFSCKKCL